MKILALDIATNTGIAVGTSGSDPLCWSENLGKGPEDRRFANVLRLTARLIEQHEPDLIVVEAAIGGPKASAYLIGLVANVRGCAATRGVKCEGAHLGSIRKHFLGKALTTKHFPGMKHADAKKAIKAEVVKRCQLLGWFIPVDERGLPDDDAADAVALWDYAQATYGTGYQSKPHGGLF